MKQQVRRIAPAARPAQLPSNINNMSLDQLTKLFKTRQGGWQREDHVAYERVTVTHGAANVLTLFTTDRRSDGITVTNFEKAGELDKQTALLIQEIAIDIEPAGNPAAFGAQAAANRVNDVHYLASRGLLTIHTGSNRQTAFSGGPLRIFPGNNGVTGAFALADATTLGSDKQSRIDLPLTVGLPLRLKRPILILPGEIFGGSLDFGSSALSLPSASNASLLIRYSGLKFTVANN